MDFRMTNSSKAKSIRIAGRGKNSAGPPIDWLLNGEPFVRYRTLVDLLGKQEGDRDVRSARQAICRDALVAGIFEKRNKEGYWGTARDIRTWWPKKDTTFWILGVLADFGVRKENPAAARAAEYVFGEQLDCGAFGWGPPPTPGECFTGILVEALAKLGYSKDPRLLKAYEWLVARQRNDGGFWCKSTAQPGMPRQSEPSCAYGTLCVLGALSQNSDFKSGSTARKCAAFLLECWDKKGKIKFAGHDSQIGRDWEKLKYPFTDYRILKYLDVMSCFDFVRDDPRIGEMVQLLISKEDKNGCYTAESIHKAWSDFDFGQKISPSRWITLLGHRIIKRIGRRRGS
jgi:hypothetical protein